jgi:hypothetical protein
VARWWWLAGTCRKPLPINRAKVWHVPGPVKGQRSSRKSLSPLVFQSCGRAWKAYVIPLSWLAKTLMKAYAKMAGRGVEKGAA